MVIRKKICENPQQNTSAKKNQIKQIYGTKFGKQTSIKNQKKYETSSQHLFNDQNLKKARYTEEI